MKAKQLFDEGDRVCLSAIRAYRVLPGDIYWGVGMSPGKPRKGFVVESEGVPAPDGAVTVADSGKVRIGPFLIGRDELVLVQAR